MTSTGQEVVLRLSSLLALGNAAQRICVKLVGITQRKPHPVVDSLLSPAAIHTPDRAGLFPTESELVAAAGGGKIARTARDGGPMIDPETKRAWHRLQKEVKENAPIVLRGLASSGKRLPSRLYSAVVRGCKSLTRRAKEWNASFGGRKAVVSQLSRLRLRSPIYKV